MNALGLDPETAAEVTAYIGEQPDYGTITPGTEAFSRMESLSRDAVMKLEWRDLEHSPRLPLERVFVQCGCRDADSAKEIVAYVLRAMLADTGRNADPRLTDMLRHHARVRCRRVRGQGGPEPDRLISSPSSRTS